MSPVRLLPVLLLILTSLYCEAQTDSVLQSLQQVPNKYIKQVDKKIDKYTNRITTKTEETLTKLAKWENKIHGLLLKTNPVAAQRLFASDQLTFATALEKYKKGEAVIEGQKAKYDEYRDKLTTSIKYLETKKDSLNAKLLHPLKDTKDKLDKLEEEQTQTEAIEQFIKERRKQLINQSLQYIGNSKYLTKISKESYYYEETLRNYKAIFSDKKKAEEAALHILNKIPGFTKFTRQNSMLATLFGSPSNVGNTPNLAGLQSRASVNALIQNQIAAGGPNAREQIMQNIQEAQAKLSQLKDKIIKAGGNTNGEMPDFKPNQTKSQTFKQRLEFGNNFQFSKNNSLVPEIADLGLSIGYKLNDKSIIGIGASYKMGLGSINHISITHQGIGLRSFMDWKLKKQFFITGGYEMNYNAAFKNIEQLKSFNDWQNAGLVGLTKKINTKTKWAKGTKLQLLYDMLARQHAPVTHPVIFRVGYNF